MENLNQLAEIARNNLGFVVLSVLVVTILVASAYAAEVVLSRGRKKSGDNNISKVKRMTIIAVLSAIAVVLMLFEFPLWFLPGFYKLDLSELPVIIGAFTLGPVAGVVIEFLKVVLNLLTDGTTTVFVGEFANFLVGCAFVIPASVIYFMRKSRKNAMLGLIVGTVITTAVGGVLNAYMLLPKYAQLMSTPISTFVGMGTEKNAFISDLSTFVLFAVVPFNLIKYTLVSVITILIYKKISHILKG